MTSSQLSTWITENLSPVLTAVESTSFSIFSTSPFRVLLLGVLGLSLFSLVLGLIKR